MVPEKILKSSLQIVLCVNFLISLYVYYFVVGTKPENIAANDFSHFYTSGRITLKGKSPDLYNLNIFNQFQKDTSSPHTPPRLTYRSLPFVSLWFVPFSILSYSTAYLAFIFISFGLLSLSIYLIQRLTKPELSFHQILIISLLFPPITISFAQGQTSILLLFFLVAALLSIKLNKHYLSGLLVSLTLIKPHLFIIFWIFSNISLKSIHYFWGTITGICLFTVASLFMVGIPPLLNYPNYLLATETTEYGTYSHLYGSLYSFINLLLSNRSALIFSILMFFCILFWFIKRRNYLNTVRSVYVSFFLILPFTYHTPIYEYSLLLPSLLWLLSQSIDSPNQEIYFSLFVLNYSVFILSWVAGFQSIIGFISLMVGLFLLSFNGKSPNPKFHPKPTANIWPR